MVPFSPICCFQIFYIRSDAQQNVTQKAHSALQVGSYASSENEMSKGIVNNFKIFPIWLKFRL
jgi:hypothetical protein